MTLNSIESVNIQQLNQDHAIRQDGHTVRVMAGKGDMPVVEIHNPQASALISLQGAHLLSWVPNNESKSIIWVSQDAHFAPGKSVRGGIPVCWPWFSAHATQPNYPAHGFARTRFWQLVSATPLETGETQITFMLDTRELGDNINSMWPQPTVLEYRLTIGTSLTLQLTTTNHSDQAITIGQALHTYFAVDEIAFTKVEGLDGKAYLDKPQGFALKTQTGPITFSEEVDRVYLDTADDVTIHDGKRIITISKQGSRSTVVWNPWQTVAEKMGDLGKDGYRKMLCVESANAAEDVVTIEPGKSHMLQVKYVIS